MSTPSAQQFSRPLIGFALGFCIVVSADSGSSFPATGTCRIIFSIKMQREEGEEKLGLELAAQERQHCDCARREALFRAARNGATATVAQIQMPGLILGRVPSASPQRASNLDPTQI